MLIIDDYRWLGEVEEVERALPPEPLEEEP
jgi:hypothetical protein